MIISDQDVRLMEDILRETSTSITHKADVGVCDCADRWRCAVRAIEGLLFHKITPQQIAEALAEGLFPDSLRSLLKAYSGVSVEVPRPAWARGVPGPQIGTKT
jgi:hypothetical protein